MGGHHSSSGPDVWSSQPPESRAHVRSCLGVHDRMRLRSTCALNAREEYTPPPSWAVVHDHLHRKALRVVLAQLAAAGLLDLLIAGRLFATTAAIEIRTTPHSTTLGIDVSYPLLGETLSLLAVARFRPFGGRPKHRGHEKDKVLVDGAVPYVVASIRWRATTSGSRFFIYTETRNVTTLWNEFLDYFTPEARAVLTYSQEKKT